MASLKDARGLAGQLHSLSGRLESELEKGSVDFEKLVELSDEIGESADRLATTFNAINGSLTGLIEDGSGGDPGSDAENGETKEAAGTKGSRSRRGGGGSRAGGQRGRQKKEDA
jgi:hypothetical protein